MQSNTATNFQPIVSDDKKVEVSLDDDKASIKLSTWVEDLGWCGQKTLDIDIDMLDELHSAITAARYKANKQRINDGENIESSKVLEFPVFS